MTLTKLCILENNFREIYKFCLFCKNKTRWKFLVDFIRENKSLQKSYKKFRLSQKVIGHVLLSWQYISTLHHVFYNYWFLPCLYMGYYEFIMNLSWFCYAFTTFVQSPFAKIKFIKIYILFNLQKLIFVKQQKNSFALIFLSPFAKIKFIKIHILLDSQKLIFEK